MQSTIFGGELGVGGDNILLICCVFKQDTLSSPLVLVKYPIFKAMVLFLSYRKNDDKDVIRKYLSDGTVWT